MMRAMLVSLFVTFSLAPFVQADEKFAPKVLKDIVRAEYSVPMQEYSRCDWRNGFGVRQY